MLILARKPGQVINITCAESLDPGMPIGELFINGPIEIIINRIVGKQVRVGINAHPGLLILRQELEVSGSLPTSDFDQPK